MYENMTFENIMDRCLARVSASVDKREGSSSTTQIAPAAAELAILYIELAYLMDRAFRTQKPDDDLDEEVSRKKRVPVPGRRPDDDVPVTGRYLPLRKERDGYRAGVRSVGTNVR